MKRSIVVAAAVAVALIIAGAVGAQQRDLTMDASMDKEIDLERAKPMELMLDASFYVMDDDAKRIILRGEYLDGSSMRFYSNRKVDPEFLMWDKDLEVFIVDGSAPQFTCLVEGASRLMGREFACEGEYRLYFFKGRRGAKELISSGVFREGEGIQLPKKAYGRVLLEMDGIVRAVATDLNMRKGVEGLIQGK